ncbi:MAG TPA: hypothetical protein VEV81_07605 [Pyrinomonadaceae bacterium]|nr:hypothetical protein [Pyrinomonadaceae bacterium]
MIHKISYLSLTVVVLLNLIAAARPEVKVTIENNTGSAATGSFQFRNIPSPARDDAASRAKLTLVVGAKDSNGAELRALTDGLLPNSEDDPRANFFFRAGSDGGRFSLDLGRTIEISQVNTYSWHHSTRGSQVYNLYASDGTGPGFNAEPDNKTDPAACGWKLVASVDTRPAQGVGGGQYGVSLSGSDGLLGRYRYLLFDTVPTEYEDPFGNTFFSEVDVVERK